MPHISQCFIPWCNLPKRHRTAACYRWKVRQSTSPDRISNTSHHNVSRQKCHQNFSYFFSRCLHVKLTVWNVNLPSKLSSLVPPRLQDYLGAGQALVFFSSMIIWVVSDNLSWSVWISRNLKLFLLLFQYWPTSSDCLWQNDSYSSYYYYSLFSLQTVLLEIDIPIN